MPSPPSEDTADTPEKSIECHILSIGKPRKLDYNELLKCTHIFMLHDTRPGYIPEVFPRIQKPKPKQIYRLPIKRRSESKSAYPFRHRAAAFNKSNNAKINKAHQNMTFTETYRSQSDLEGQDVLHSNDNSYEGYPPDSLNSIDRFLEDLPMLPMPSHLSDQPITKLHAIYAPNFTSLYQNSMRGEGGLSMPCLVSRHPRGPSPAQEIRKAPNSRADLELSSYFIEFLKRRKHRDVKIEESDVQHISAPQTRDLSVELGNDQDISSHPELSTYSHDMKRNIMNWVDDTQEAYTIRPMPMNRDSESFNSSDGESRDSLSDIMIEDLSQNSSILMVQEVMHILQSQAESLHTGSLLTNNDPGCYTTSTASRSSSPKSGTTSTSTQSGIRGDASQKSPIMPLDGGGDEEPPNKKFRRYQDPSLHDVQPGLSLGSQMPCPLLNSSGCLGTNPTISEMLRSLQNKHRIIICKDCCSQIEVPEDEKKPESILRRHASSECEPRCISQDCLTSTSPASLHHKRTENCPSWKALSKEIRWSFVWTVISPGQEPPSPNFVVGTGYEHCQERKPCKGKSRDKGLELCQNIMADLKNNKEQIQFLEHELETSTKNVSQIQQQCDEKIARLESTSKAKVANLENIIETLLEQFRDKDMSIPRSLWKRISQECLGCLPDMIAPFTPMQPSSLPTPNTIPMELSSSSEDMVPTSNPTMDSRSNPTLPYNNSATGEFSEFVGPEFFF